MRALHIPLLLLILILATSTLQAQTDQKKIDDQKRKIENLERQIADREREINSLKKGRSTAEQRARTLARQIETRNTLLNETEAEEQDLKRETASADSTANLLDASLERHRERYAGMVREAWRNYRHNNYLSYLFAAEDFADVARRIANLREVASLRERQMKVIDSLKAQTAEQRALLERRRYALDSVQESLKKQKKRLQEDAAEARASVKQLSKKEQSALKKKVEQERLLDDAVAELRKLTKGNKQGASFSKSTSNLNLPVVGGKVKKYMGNMAEISGPKGAEIRSIYEGKVVDIKRNRITGKYDVYIAHGEYITSYANLSAVVVERNASVKRNQRIGTIGSSVDVITMQNEYTLVFGIYPPDPKQKMSASDCFRK
ncbi:MAG: peptidase [Rikenellaceae bacterium]|nr:peptidase [Rikenellaceae bacterium]